MNALTSTVIGALLILMGSVAYVYMGGYDVGADVPHAKPVVWLLDTIRERSIAARARNVAVPALDDPALIAMGARHYDAMCAGCHLAPGVADSELRVGLYPRPPDLSVGTREPPKSFWIIKHGIKMTAMPAWGQSHDDHAIWGLVAFLEALPGFSPQQYERLTRVGEGVHDHRSDEHGHAIGDSDAHE